MKMIIYMEANWKYNKFAVKNHGLKPFLGEGDHMSITLKHSLQNRNTQTFANFVLYVLKRQVSKCSFLHWILQHPLISHLILIYPPKKGHRMEIVQFYYFCPFSAWTNAIVLLLLHWPHPASTHLLQQGDVYLQQEEIKALLHEQQICKSYTVQIDCEAHTTDSGVLGHPLSPSDLKSKSRHAELQDTHGLSGKKKKSARWDIKGNK